MKSWKIAVCSVAVLVVAYFGSKLLLGQSAPKPIASVPTSNVKQETASAPIKPTEKEERFLIQKTSGELAGWYLIVRKVERNIQPGKITRINGGPNARSDDSLACFVPNPKQAQTFTKAEAERIIDDELEGKDVGHPDHHQIVKAK